MQRFLDAYLQISDLVLIADGGSNDLTKAIAQSYDRVFVRDFQGRQQGTDNPTVWANPEAEHINFLIDWAQTLKPTWILMDDCDSIPSAPLLRTARKQLLESDHSVARVRRWYMWGWEHHFPDMAKPGLGVWGWRANTLRTVSPHLRHFEFDPNPDALPSVDFDTPSVLLHNSWPKKIDSWLEKQRFYEAFGFAQKYPPASCGPLEELPRWARE